MELHLSGIYLNPKRDMPNGKEHMASNVVELAKRRSAYSRIFRVDHIDVQAEGLFDSKTSANDLANSGVFTCRIHVSIPFPASPAVKSLTVFPVAL